MNLHPEQCRAARGLLDWTQEELARRAGISRSTVRDFECHRHELHRISEASIVEALEQEGISLLYCEREGMGVRKRA